MLLLSCSVLLPGVTGLLVGAKNPAGKVIKENTTGCDKNFHLDTLHTLNCTAFAIASAVDNIVPKVPGPRAV